MRMTWLLFSVKYQYFAKEDKEKLLIDRDKEHGAKKKKGKGKLYTTRFACCLASIVTDLEKYRSSWCFSRFSCGKILACDHWLPIDALHNNTSR